MKKQVLFGAFVIMMVFSCRTPTNTTTEEQAPVPAGTIEGFAALFDEFGNAATNNSGITVSLDSTGHSTTTDSNGLYVLKNIAANTSYNFTFSKSGYSSYHYTDYAYTIPSGLAPVLVNVGTSVNGIYKAQLFPVSETVAQSCSVFVSSPNISLYATVMNSNPSYTSSYSIGAQFFMSTSKYVSSTLYEYTTSVLASNSNPATVSAQYSINSFPSGTTIYIVAYGITGVPSQYGSSINPNINGVPSSVTSVVIP